MIDSGMPTDAEIAKAQRNAVIEECAKVSDEFADFWRVQYTARLEDHARLHEVMRHDALRMARKIRSLKSE